jgi:hypothetical protein
VSFDQTPIPVSKNPTPAATGGVSPRKGTHCGRALGRALPRHPPDPPPCPRAVTRE